MVDNIFTGLLIGLFILLVTFIGAVFFVTFTEEEIVAKCPEPILCGLQGMVDPNAPEVFSQEWWTNLCNQSPQYCDVREQQI